MPYPLSPDTNIIVQKKLLPGDYCMPNMRMATNHYNIGYNLSGDRYTITPLQCYEYHAGDVAMCPPYVAHRTISLSSDPYESYFIKFTPEFIRPFLEDVGKNIFEELYAQKICHFTSDAQKKIETMFREMLEEYEKQKPYTELVLQGMLNRLFITIYEEKLSAGAKSFDTPLTEPVINAIAYINSQYAQNISLKELAHASGLSAAYMSRLFHAQLGTSFSDYLTNTRIYHATILLSQTRKSVTEIALETGFCSGDYLSAQFKAKIGLTPTQFRKTPITDWSPYTSRPHNYPCYI